MERKSRKIGIIGHFGGKENILDGQTIKTKILHEELSKACLLYTSDAADE